MSKAFFNLFGKARDEEKAYPNGCGLGKYIIDKNKCKTFNQKIQWIKLYGITDLMRKCTDKVAVRDYVAEKIGSEYLKPVLQIIPKQKALNAEPSLRQISRWREISSLTDEGADLSAGTTTFTVLRQSSRLEGNMSLSDNISTSTDASSQLDCRGLNRPRSDGEINDLQSNLNKETNPTNYSQSVPASADPSPENLTLVPRVDFLPSPPCRGVVRKSSRFPLPWGHSRTAEQSEACETCAAVVWAEGAVVSEVTSVTNAGEGLALADNNDPSTYFDQIDFAKLPNQFILKCSHGCKWQFIIKDKEQFLNTPQLFEQVKKQITGWLEQEYWCWGGFEMQYRVAAWKFGSLAAWKRGSLKSGKCGGLENNEVQNYKKSNYITPKLLIEPLMCNDTDKNVEEIHWFCFNGVPHVSIRIEEGTNNKITLYDSNLNFIDDILSLGDIKTYKPVDNILKQSFILSGQLSKNFNFVRADWMIYQNKLYFEELTFTPYSGLSNTLNPKYNKIFGKLINLERA